MLGGETLDEEEFDESSVDLLELNLGIELFCCGKLLLEFEIG